MPFSVTILGSSSAIPTSKRNLTAQVVNHLERFFLIDCGEGTQIQLRRFHIKFTRLQHIFISHLHADHVLGLLGLISTYSVLGRTSPLHIYADPRLEKYLKHHYNFFNEQLSFPLKFYPINAHINEIIYEDQRLTISSFPLKHRIPCVGFLFKEKMQPRKIKKEYIDLYKLSIQDIISIKNGNDLILENKIIKNEELTLPSPPARSYAYCSDTMYHPHIASYIQGVDTLYHEATFLQEDEKLAQKTFHSTAAQAAQLALDAKAGKLIIGHFSSRYKSDSQFLEEATRIFPNTFMAEDGLTFEI